MKNLKFTLPQILLTLGLAAVPTAVVAGNAPNVLMISVDDMNDWIGPMGNPYVKT